jgi:hypothetical protein
VVTEALRGDTAEHRLSTRVGARARRSAAAPRALDLVALVFYAVGALAFWTLVLAGGVVRWCWSAVALGWLEARGSASTRGLDATRWPVRAREPKRRGSG